MRASKELGDLGDLLLVEELAELEVVDPRDDVGERSLVHAVAHA